MGLFGKKAAPAQAIKDDLEKKRTSRASLARVPTTDFRDAVAVSEGSAPTESGMSEPEATALGALTDIGTDLESDATVTAESTPRKIKEKTTDVSNDTTQKRTTRASKLVSAFAPISKVEDAPTDSSLSDNEGSQKQVAKKSARHTVSATRPNKGEKGPIKPRQSEPAKIQQAKKAYSAGKKTTAAPTICPVEHAVEVNDSYSEAPLYVPPAKIQKPQADRTSKAAGSKLQPKDATVINNLLKHNTQKLMGELTPEVQRAFETLFDRLDMTDSGGITAKEIQNLIKKNTDKTLTVKQVQEVLAELDVRGTGDIEFDEFIFMLSQPGNYIRLLDKKDIKDLESTTGKTFSKPPPVNKGDPTEVFFEALRNATRQASMTALRVFYRNRLKKLNDHVIHDWSAGQRCIGLSDGEMLKRYETIQGELLRQRVNFCRDNSYKQSPYARPLEWGVVNLRQSIVHRQKQRREEQEKQANEKTRRVKMSEFVVTPKAVPLPRYGIHRRSPLKRTFDYDQLAGIREKVDDIALKYYTELKDVARDNSTIVKKELAVDEIKDHRSRENFMPTFTAYCAPFVVSPWIPMPSPTLQASFAPLGKSKHSVQK